MNRQLVEVWFVGSDKGAAPVSAMLTGMKVLGRLVAGPAPAYERLLDLRYVEVDSREFRLDQEAVMRLASERACLVLLVTPSFIITEAMVSDVMSELVARRRERGTWVCPVYCLPLPGYDNLPWSMVNGAGSQSVEAVKALSEFPSLDTQAAEASRDIRAGIMRHIKDGS